MLEDSSIRGVAARNGERNPADPADLIRAGVGDAEDEALAAVGTTWAVSIITSSLSPDQAEVALVRVIVDLGTDEVARILGNRSGTVRVLQHRALRRLACVLNGEDVAL